MTSEKGHYSGTMNGTIFVVAAGGGGHLSDYTTAIPRWSIFRDRDYRDVLSCVHDSCFPTTLAT
ncbi:hypothetical protein C2845_PM13G23580 [Panicum miliaceum]|uniref:Uncharacterized protein n=1 Tax=Panicum miliaceum TaxID=4540 RepID=A0A3L6RFM2_PANMI|nr:hypothetical protein C2845_PM13G23580 [Panicum miliaceum]